MARSIVLPLYPHTSDEEIAEILDRLRGLGLDGAHVVHAYVPDESPAADRVELYVREDGELGASDPELAAAEARVAELQERNAVRASSGRITDADRAELRSAYELRDALLLERDREGDRRGLSPEVEEFLVGPDRGELPRCKRRAACGLPAGHSGSCFGGGDRPLPLASIDQEGKRTDAPADPAAAAPVLSLDLARELQRVRQLVGEPVHGEVDRFRVERPERFRDHAEEISHYRSLELLRVASSAIAGRDGWRRTPDGREWYSADWLGLVS